MKRLFSEETQPAAGRWKSPVTILVSQCLPVLDFDQRPRAIITEPHRLYKTDNGWHILLIGRVGMPDRLFFENMQKIGVDRGYLSFVQKNGFFSLRVSPNPVITSIFNVDTNQAASLICHILNQVS